MSERVKQTVPEAMSLAIRVALTGLVREHDERRHLVLELGALPEPTDRVDVREAVRTIVA